MAAAWWGRPRTQPSRSTGTTNKRTLDGGTPAEAALPLMTLRWVSGRSAADRFMTSAKRRSGAFDFYCYFEIPK